MKTAVADGTDSATKFTHWNRSEKGQPNERRLLESGGSEIGVVCTDDFVEARHFLLELRAQATRDEIAEGRRAAQKKNRACLDLTVGLPERRQANVTGCHGMQSASVYSGSSGP